MRKVPEIGLRLRLGLRMGLRVGLELELDPGLRAGAWAQAESGTGLVLRLGPGLCLQPTGGGGGSSPTAPVRPSLPHTFC